jgi:mannose-6-phosphate isomerase-like protein (cupin superfamily)
MDVTNINKAEEWFEVLQTSELSQTAMMTLAPGDSSGTTAEAHKNSDQVLLLLEGELSGEVGGERPTLRKGDVIIIPAGVKHRFTNRAETPAVTFNVYAPPGTSCPKQGLSRERWSNFCRRYNRVKFGIKKLADWHIVRSKPTSAHESGFAQ